MPFKDSKTATLAWGLLGLLMAQSAAAFQLISRWPDPGTTFLAEIAGTSPSGTRWTDAFSQAAGAWTEQSNFSFAVDQQYADPCEDSFGTNGVDFTGDICGVSFGESTLAVTLLFFDTLNSTLIEADIAFNRAFDWDVYYGALRADAVDFRRVALHELGHALGLDHEIELPAIMFPFIGDSDRLQQDDINGVSALYPATTDSDEGPSPNANPVPRGSPIPSLSFDTGELSVPVAFADDGHAYTLQLTEVPDSEPKVYHLDRIEALAWNIANLSFSGSISPTAQVGGSVTLEGSLDAIPAPALAARLSLFGRVLTVYRIGPRPQSGRIGFALTAGADFPSGTATMEVRLVNYPEDPIGQDPWGFPVSNTLRQSVFVQ